MSDDVVRVCLRTRPRRRSRSSNAVLTTLPSAASSTAATANLRIDRSASYEETPHTSLLSRDVLELRRCTSAEAIVGSSRRPSRSGFYPFGHNGQESASHQLHKSAGPRFHAGASAPASSSASLRSHASFLMDDVKSANELLDEDGVCGVGFAAAADGDGRATSLEDRDTVADGGRLTRNMLGDSTGGRKSSGAERFRRASSLDASPPLPPDSTISAEEVIRESLASALNSSLYVDKDDFRLPHQRRSHAVGNGTFTVIDRDSFAMSKRSRDSLAFSFSSRSTFRRSTISELMLYETDLFEPERELSARELSEVLSGSDDDVNAYEVTSIKEEEEGVKLENAKSRWAQHVKLKARGFLYATVAGSKNGTVSNSSCGGDMTPTAPTSAEIWANKQKQILAQISNGSGYAVLSSSTNRHSLLPPLPSFGPAAHGGAKFQKWNRWMHDRYQHNFGKVMQRAYKDGVLQREQQQFAFPPHQPIPDPTTLISIEEVISNPRMMRYYAAWLSDPADQSKLFFLCSFEEYRQFWCTLRANNQRQPLAKDDVLMLRTYGVKIAMKYLAKNAQFPINGPTSADTVEGGSDEPPLVEPNRLRSIKHDLAAGGEDALRTFDDVAVKVKRLLMFKFPEFRKTELYAEMQKTVEREVICLEDILMNHRFGNFFWIFLFPHNYHREIALWLDVEYEFKPAFRIYMSMLKASGSSRSAASSSSNQRRERIEQSAYRCRRLLKYISQKYYAGDAEMQTLSRTLVTSCARLQAEQDAILTRFSLIHLELYHRFLTSRAYAEFSLYPKLSSEDEKDSIDDFMRLSALLLSYGLRAHHWAGGSSSTSSSPSSTREADATTPKKKTLDSLRTAQSFDAVSGVLTFEAVSVPLMDEEAEYGADNSGAFEDPIELHIVQHQLPHDPAIHVVDKSIENFLVPWCADPRHVVVTASSCPAPLAFNFRMGDSSAGASAAEFFAACIVLYKPAPPLSRRVLETSRVAFSSSCRWVPYGVCVLSKFPMVDLLRERLAEAYEYILELETIAAATTPNTDADISMTIRNGGQGFQLDKRVLAKLTRAVSKEHISQYHKPSPLPESPLLESSGLVPKATAASLLASLPRLDHSVRLLFDTLDVSTVLLVFTAALLENRILLVSSYLSVLMKVAESLRALMHPLSWPHVYLPVLPRRMLQYLECPTPFIFGAEKQALDDAQRQVIEEGGDDLFAGAGEELLVVDLDKGAVLRGEVPCALPDSVRFGLRDALYECLKPNVSRSDHVFAHHFPSKPLVFPEIAVRGLFLRTINKLIGDFGYHRYVWTDEFARLFRIHGHTSRLRGTTRPV
uniref:UDENN domain-containing protein n=1 Tax=Hyaloperonospora arabidopsidis (strain Emoy2) TaxID=559515 RepID=M4BZ44_HYAAE